MSSTRLVSSNGASQARPEESLVKIALPTGTPLEAEVAVRRLIELVGILARRAAQLQEALDSRVVIEQAKGILAERFDLSPDEAFVLLRRAARSNRMQLRQLAAAVVSSPETPRQLDGVLGRRPPLRTVSVPRAGR